MTVANPDAYDAAIRYVFAPNSPSSDKWAASLIGSVTGLGAGSRSPTGVFDKRPGTYALDSAECGWYQNTSGSSQTVRVRNAFGFGGYSMGCWVIVDSTAPSSMAPTPAASASAAGATQLAIASGGGSSAASIVVPNGSYLYVVQIDVDITWAGSSHQFVELQTTGGTDLKLISFFPSPSAGHFVDSWKSDLFVTGGTKYPPNGVYGENVQATARWGHYQHFLLPNNWYYYVVAGYHDITWSGASDEHILLWDEGNATRGGDYAVGWPSPGAGPHNTEEWDSAWFVAGGTNLRPSTKWVDDGGTLNGAGSRQILNPSPSPVGASVGHGNGWYQNTTGGDLKLRAKTNFIAAGYTMKAWILPSADGPSTITPPGGGGGGGGGSTKRQSVIITARRRLVVPDLPWLRGRRIWVPDRRLVRPSFST